VANSFSIGKHLFFIRQATVFQAGNYMSGMMTSPFHAAGPPFQWDIHAPLGQENDFQPVHE
jgi:hypothetical protein